MTKVLSKISILVFLIAPHFLLAQDINFREYNIGLTQKDQADYKAAVHSFSNFIEDYPKEYPKAYFQRGYVYFYLKNYTSAIVDFEYFHELTSQNAESTYTLGRIYFQLQHYEKAISYFTKTLAIDPFHARSHNDRGLLLFQLRKFDQALADFHKATELDTSFAMAYNNLGAARYFKQDIAKPTKKDIQFAENWFSKAIEQDPTLSIAYRNRGAMRIFLKAYDEAIKDLVKAGQLNPKDAMIQFYIGVAYTDQGAFSSAISFFNKAIVLDPKLPFAYEELGNLYKTKKAYDQSINYYRQAQKVRKNIGQLYVGLIDYRIALTYAEQENEVMMYAALKDAKRNKAFKDMQVYQDFTKAKEFKVYRLKKKFKKFRKSIRKGSKDNKFLNPDLGWFRMRK